MNPHIQNSWCITEEQLEKITRTARNLVHEDAKRLGIISKALPVGHVQAVLWALEQHLCPEENLVLLNYFQGREE